jgi:hypothetical protein
MMKEAKAVTKVEDGKELSPTRANRRYVPLKPVSAVILADDCYLAHGVVSNISTSGACLITNTVMENGSDVRVQFAANQHEELFQLEARIVWSSEGMDPNLEIVGVMVGLQFLDMRPMLQEKISDILEQGYFHEVGVPSREDCPDVPLDHPNER